MGILSGLLPVLLAAPVALAFMFAAGVHDRLNKVIKSSNISRCLHALASGMDRLFCASEAGRQTKNIDEASMSRQRHITVQKSGSHRVLQLKPSKGQKNLLALGGGQAKRES